MGKVLLLGYFGAGNFGDDALLCDWLVRWGPFLREHSLLADVVAHSAQLIDGFIEKQQLASLVSDVFSREDALKSNPADYCALIAPGGSLLQDATSRRSLLYYLWLIRRFTTANRPVYLLNQGFGPFNSWVSRFLAPRILRACRFISCRDTESLAWAGSPGRLEKHPELHASADPILAARIAADRITVESWQLPEEYVLVLPRPTGDLPSPGDEISEPEALARLLNATTETTGLPVVLLPLHPAHDTAFAEAAAALAPGSRVLPQLPDQVHKGTAIWTTIGQARLVISYRLHGIIAAAAHGVPALGIAYDPKVENCCLGLGLPYCFPATVHEQAALEDVARLWANLDESRIVVTENGAEQLAKLSNAEQRYQELWEQDCR